VGGRPHLFRITACSAQGGTTTTRAALDETLRSRLEAVCADGWAFWERFDATVRERDFHPFVAADYDAVLDALIADRQPGRRFLEWGSASGVITVLADLLGFDACGIELDAALVADARALAARAGSRARFVAGSFLPTGYRWRAPDGDDDPGTIGDGPSGYLQLGLALDDFDVVFGYPWSGEAPMMRDLMQRYGRPDALLLLNDITHGVRRYRNGKELAPGSR
jgi:hypothetical protein